MEFGSGADAAESARSFSRVLVSDIRAYRKHRADRIVAETNQGGDMVEATVRMVDPNVSFKAVHASRGKAIRAEPVAALYEQGKVHHAGGFSVLEDQMCSFTADYERSRGNSPDRVDALVWALTELMVEGVAGWGIMEHYRRGAQRQQQGAVDAPTPAATVRLRAPEGFAASTLITITGRSLLLGNDRTVEVSEEDAAPLVSQQGWARVEERA